MNDDNSVQPTHVPARDIPVPAHLSPEARMGFGPIPDAPLPPSPTDKDGWRAYVAQVDAGMMAMAGAVVGAIPATVEERVIGAATVYIVTPAGVAPDDPRVYLDIHGGGFVFGGGPFGRICGLLAASMTRTRAWSVDYRMPPDHPYPAALDDCVAVYRALLAISDPRHIAIGGASAGANLAAATILRARAEGLPLPAAAALISPGVDLTESGDSFATNLGLDRVLTSSLMSSNLLYANGHDLADPYLSPLFGDFAKGFPPTILTTGTRDLFLSNTVRMHAALRAADVLADLYVIEAASHAGFPGAPENVAQDREIRRFLEARWG